MSESGHQIGFDQLGIGSVLVRHQLKVPLNQREYSWTDREVKNLLQDFSRAVSENAPEYFLGSVVSIPRALSFLEIVDGQQRLATTAVLLAAIRDALKGRPSDALIVENIEHSFLTAIDTKARDRVPRLQLNVTDAEYFNRRILRSDESVAKTARSHHLIDRAAALAKAHVASVLRGFNDTDFGDVLDRWVQFIQHRAIVILLKVPSDINAYTMFETLNDRGLRTSQADLVKNYLFGQAGTRLQEAQHKWSVMKGLIESIDDDDDITIVFLRQTLISLFGHITRAQVYETVQKNAKGTQAAIEFMVRMERSAGDYSAILNPEHQKWNKYPPETRRSIHALITFRTTPMRPLVLSIAREFIPKETDAALRFLVRLAVRYLIVGGMRSGSVEEGMNGAAKAISDGKIATAKQLKTELKAITPSDAEFREQFARATVSKESLARYYLRCLEQQVGDVPNPYFEPVNAPDVVNLEHVLPIRPQGNWPGFTPESAEAFHRRLGNMALMLAKTNSAAGNGSFQQKKAAYSATSYELTRQIATVDEWTPETISQRQTHMAKLAIKTWPV